MSRKCAVSPALNRRGISDAQIQTMLVDNPKTRARRG
jgi:predicted metal-dependent phosphotriesterase family hydrolase